MDIRFHTCACIYPYTHNYTHMRAHTSTNTNVCTNTHAEPPGWQAGCQSEAVLWIRKAKLDLEVPACNVSPWKLRLKIKS